MREQREGGAVLVGGLGLDVDHRERSGRAGRTGAFMGTVRILRRDTVDAQAEGTSGRRQGALGDDQFGMFAAVQEEGQLVVSGSRAVFFELKSVAWPAVKGVTHPQVWSGGDFSRECYGLIDVRRIRTTGFRINDLIDL